MMYYMLYCTVVLYCTILYCTVLYGPILSLGRGGDALPNFFTVQQTTSGIGHRVK